MNGRIYDAKLARFLQADPFIQSPYDTQMLNRYSYVRNNPLNATDPSGYFAGLVAGLIAAKLGADALVIAIVVGVATTAQALVMGADLGDALQAGFISGISSFAFSQIGEHFAGLESASERAFAEKLISEGFDPNFARVFAQETVGLTAGQTLGKIAAHAVTGGIFSALQGGKFGHGFAAAGVTQAFAGKINGLDRGSRFAIRRVGAAAILGGTVSKITGGKFANGAVTGAFSRAFNDEFHLSIQAKRPRFFGVIAEFLGADPSVDGVALSLAVSYPNTEGEGEYDLGLAVTTDINSKGLSTGRLAIGYGESYDSAASVKDLAGFEPTIQTDFGAGGLDFSSSGWNIHIGSGGGASYSIEATSVLSLRHRRWFTWNETDD